MVVQHAHQLGRMQVRGIEVVGIGKGMGCRRSIGECFIDPGLLVGDITGVVVGRHKLIEEHERDVFILKGI